MLPTMRNGWIDQVFAAQIVLNGGTVRRSIKDVEVYGGGVDNFLGEVKKLGFHVVQVGDQLVVLCNKGDIKVLL
jgi:phosphosulfolactate synthase (CoM biosynthesis protein A)